MVDCKKIITIQKIVKALAFRVLQQEIDTNGLPGSHSCIGDDWPCIENLTDKEREKLAKQYNNFVQRLFEQGADALPCWES